MTLSVPAAHAQESDGPPPHEPDPALAFITGASVFLVGFGLGGVVLTANSRSRADQNAGWLTIQSGFALAPLAAHAVTGEWTRGALFATVPTAAALTSGTLIAVFPNAIMNGQLPKQRALWGSFGVGLFSSVVGIVDATFVRKRMHSVTIAPSVGAGTVGLDVGGTLW
ncbi:MAG TPA: hypothetical protein VH142_12495 [Polyangiaceae bacterium]|jgi:hypothetical protein|nr:hypothetical protein [Polyangiaceae bacterium]